MERSLILLLLTSPLCLFSPIALFAKGGKPTVVKGHADYEYDFPKATETIHVSDKTILEYKNFNIDVKETTQYVQPSSKSTLLCRVKGNEASVISGKLQANGKLLFVNPNGIFFTHNAQVNVGSLIASVLDISNDNFLNDRFKFELGSGLSKSRILNEGQIEAEHDVIFMAPTIVNRGTVSAKMGKIVLAAGEIITLDFDGDSMIQFAVEAPFKDGCIEQSGKLISPEIYLHLPTAQRVIREVLNTTGLVEAGYIVCEEGVIRLKEGSYTTAKKLYLTSGDAIEIVGKIQASELCELAADQEILWMGSNVIGNLVTKTPRFVMGESITAENWTHHAISSLPIDVPYSQKALENSHILQNCKPLSIDAPLHLQGDLLISAPYHDVQFEKEINGSAGLIVQACGVNFKDNIGLKGALDTTVQGPVCFEGNLYEASYHNLKATSFTFSTQGEVTLSADSSAIHFHDGLVHLGENTSLTVVSKAGSITLPEIEGHVSSSLAASAPRGSLKLGAVNGVGSLTLASHLTTPQSTLQAGSISFTGSGPVHLSHNVIAQIGDLTSTAPLVFHTSEIVLEAAGDIRFERELIGPTKLEMRAFKGEIDLKGSLGGETKKLKDVTLTGLKVTQHEKLFSDGAVHYKADEIHLGDNIYTDNTIKLEGAVTLFGGQTIHLIGKRYNQGNVTLTSTLNAATQETSLKIEKGGSLTQIEGPVGQNGPLTNLSIKSKSLILGSVGSSEPGVTGVIGLLDVNISDKVELRGNTYYAGEVKVNGKSTKLDVTSPGFVEIKAKEKGLKIDSKILLTKPTGFHVSTQDGPLSLDAIISSVDLPVTIQAGRGDISLLRVGESDFPQRISHLNIEGGKITLNDSVNADNIKITALGDITQGSGPPSLNSAGNLILNSVEGNIKLEGVLKGKHVTIDAAGGDVTFEHSIGSAKEPAEDISITARKSILFSPKKAISLISNDLEMDPNTVLFAETKICLNAKGGSVGELGKAVSVKVFNPDPKAESPAGILYVGSKKDAYLKGECRYSTPHAIQGNEPPKIYFNGKIATIAYSYEGKKVDDQTDQALLKSLHPALTHKTPVDFMGGVVIQPRGAPIYYDASGK